MFLCTLLFPAEMDVESYDSLFKRIKDSLIYSSDLNRKSFVASHFSLALSECNSCVTKALELATKLLKHSNFQVNKLCGYIDNAITLLQNLSDFIKNVLESAAMACCNMKPFPTTTGHIILAVFMHCKDSECIYGHHLKSVETQLKDLFRTCHELQLTYLMTLEKHFIFDLTEKEEQEILVEALTINMKIGEIVQALDIKTMAEQWKAYTVICEKYSSFLLNKNIYNDCSQLFVTIIKDNIKTAIECEQENKSTVRSLKVASFTIKILSRVSNVFKLAVTNDYEHIVELLQYIYIHHPAHLHISAEKSHQFINLLSTNVLSPTEALCSILIQDDRFLHCVHKVNVKNLETNTLLGHIVLIISMIKAAVQRPDDQVLKLGKRKLIDCVYQILPLGHYWFNMGLRFLSNNSTGNENSFSLYEYLLVHVAAFAATFSSEQYAVLEKHMFEAVMNTDCYSAVFSSNLWVLLCRVSDNQLTSDTLASLVTVYQNLEKHKSFSNSPQEVHLSCLIGKLFEGSSSEVKILIGKEIQPGDMLWSVLKVSNLPEPLRKNIETTVLENLKTSFHGLIESQDLTDKEMDNLIQVMKVAATCTFTENSIVGEQCVVTSWLKVCYSNQYINSEDLGASETMWFLRYLEALVSLTECVAHKLNSTSLGKILHSMSTLLYSCNMEITILLLNLFCKLYFSRVEDETQQAINNIFKSTWDVLLQGVEASFKSYLLNILMKYKNNEKFDEISSTLFYNDESLRKDFSLNCDFKSTKWKEQLISGASLEYSHKCRGYINDNSKSYQHAVQNTISNFDLGGFLFDDEFEEPSRKKAKLDINQTNLLVESLENNTSLLCQMEHVALCNYKKRIANVIDKLRNIVS